MGGAPYWFPVVTLFVGGVVGYVADYFREGRSAERRREAGRRAFERETLLEMQNALAMLARAAGRVHYETLMAEAEPGKLPQLSDEASDSFSNTARDVARLKVRMPDATLRAEVDEFVGLCASVGLPSPDEIGSHNQIRTSLALAARFNDLNDRLGVAIREL